MTYEAPEPKWIEVFSALSEIPLRYHDKTEALKKITELVGVTMGSHACTIALIDLERKVLTQAAGFGPNQAFDKEFLRRREVSMGSVEDGISVNFKRFASGQVLCGYNLEENGQGLANERVAEMYGLRAALCYPLKSDEKIIGYLNHFISSSRRFTEDEQRIL